MPRHAEDWTKEERQAFWRFVRGRMAERRVTQTVLATALFFDRTNLTRRMNGAIRERPDTAQLETISHTLQLSAEDIARLYQLAGRVADPSATAGTTDPTAPGISSPAATGHDETRSPAREPQPRTTAEAVKSPSSPAQPLPEARRRIAWGRFPLVAVMFGLALGVVGWWNSQQEVAGAIPDSGYTLTMHVPRKEVEAGQFLILDGAASGFPARTHLWTVVHGSDYYWPQRQVVRVGTGWFGQARVGGGPADKGKPQEVLVIMASPSANRVLQDWLSQGDRTGLYPPLTSLPVGTRVVGSTTIDVE